MYFAAQDRSIRPPGVQAIPFGEKIFQRPALRKKTLPLASIGSFKSFTLSPPIRSSRQIVYLVPVRLKRHARSEIRQMKPHPRHLYCYATRGVQTEEPYPRLASSRHIGPYIQFRKR